MRNTLDRPKCDFRGSGYINLSACYGGTVMGEHQNRATLDALVAALNAGDLEALDRVFANDIVMEWPQSRERIVGGQNRREVYSRFPSLPHVTPRRIMGCDDLWTVEASLDYGDGDPYMCVFIFEMHDGLIVKETGYWSKPFPAPDWRAPWVVAMA
jgi:ketosteroid isomerase-like protein